MNREQKREILKRKIVISSARLFAEQGYEKTSMRQIVKESKISSGSIYHFFKNKESILFSIFFENIYNQLLLLNQEMIREFKKPLIQFSVSAAVLIAVVLENPKSLNLFRVSWTIQAIEETVLQISMKRTRDILENSNLDATYTDDEIYVRELSVNRALGALCEARSTGRASMKVEDIWTLIIIFWLSGFGFSQAKIDTIVKQTKEIMRKRGNRIKKKFLSGFIKDFI
ncbi:MAG: TetR/AcrR family transcriptional regulator [Desulfatitalea sp.]|nr:TetR/AcrR family transcriptional regulator [Desulfatitalea sp.]